MNIKEVTQKTGLSTDTIRYYEKEKLLSVSRSVSGYRDFNAENLERLVFIKNMRRAGLGIAVLQRYCALLDDEVSHDAEQRELLIQERRLARQRLNKLTEALTYLDWKIDVYYEAVKTAGDRSRSKNK